mgnify:CR=1 FL=1
MFVAGERVRRAGEETHGTVMSVWSKHGPRRYRVEWEDGRRSICKPSDIREVPKCAGGQV